MALFFSLFLSSYRCFIVCHSLHFNSIYIHVRWASIVRITSSVLSPCKCSSSFELKVHLSSLEPIFSQVVARDVLQLWTPNTFTSLLPFSYDIFLITAIAKWRKRKKNKKLCLKMKLWKKSRKNCFNAEKEWRNKIKWTASQKYN